ncbi:tetratricopeptide repeat protein, partial [Candidatus Desantisbacteria bacterium]|nr:tetratricopeptide repeat protein [Candidatus Desantisbacteria bacterium]
KKGIIEKAEQSYQNAIKLIPEHPYAYRQIGEMYRNKGIKGLGKKEIEKAEMLDKKFSVVLMEPSIDEKDFYSDIGLEYLKKDDLEKVKEYFSKSIEVKSEKNYRGYYNIAQIYMKKNDMQEAEKMFKIVLEINPEFEPGLIGLCDLYYKNNNYKNAFLYLKKAIQVNPFEGEYYLKLGSIYKELNMREEARTTFLKYLEVEPFGKDIDNVKKYLSELK